jgi:prolyl-tRNA editing enzyme YbaK/EbsC (Cys-tRNA(Pro) deacylase)
VDHDPVARALSQVGITPAFRTFPEGTDTAEQAAAAIGCHLGAIVKSLIFMSKRESGDEMVLVLICGSDRLDEKKLAAELGYEVRKATAKEVEERTGFKIGTVPPVGHRIPMEVFIDRELMMHSPVWAASGVRHRVFPIAPVMLCAASGAMIAEIRALQ